MDPISENPGNSTATHLKPILISGLLSVLIYLSGFLVWLTPLPILYAFKKGREKQGFAAVAVGAVLLGLLYFVLIPWVGRTFGESRALDFFFWVPGMGPDSASQDRSIGLVGVGYYGFFALLGALLGVFEPKPLSVTRLFGQTLGILVLLLVLGITVYSRGDLLGFVAQIQADFVELIHSIGRTAPQASDEVKAQLDWIQKNAELIAYYAVRLLPAMLLNMMIFEIWLNIVVARKLFYKDLFFSQIGALRRWRLPFFGVWAVIAAITLLLLNSYAPRLFPSVEILQQDWVRLLAANVLIVFGLIYFFQGLAIVVFYTIRWSLSPLARFMVYALLIIACYFLGSILIAFGFFDSWFDFRKINRAPNYKTGTQA